MRLVRLALLTLPVVGSALDLTRAVVVSRGAPVAAQVLAEEVERRCGVRWSVGASQAGLPSIVISIDGGGRAEGYRIAVRGSEVQIAGADARGALFGAGYLLRKLEWAAGRVSVDDGLAIATAPASPIRGHQLGYRSTANSYDAWTVEQYERYIRELTFFGVNSIEAIPFHDSREAPLMKVPRREMNRAVSEICARYGLDYWAWAPADFDLKDPAKRAAMLERTAEFFRDAKTFTGFFFPGGDPGDNDPAQVFAFLEDVAKQMAPLHPKARIWVSLQGFNRAKVDASFDYINQHKPAWLGGLVAGPSSPPIQPTRARLPKQYGLRLYPDLTHNKICQYQVPNWDQAYALTLGREAVNPRPAEFKMIHNWFAGLSDGFISYSDGVHDDVNKIVWSAMSWDPATDVREVLTDYARVYFQPAVSGEAADAILALERNWRGPLIENGAVEGTLMTWQRLAAAAPGLESSWRWQMCLLRANYDAYVRRRLLHETGLEDEANASLLRASAIGSERAMKDAEAALGRAPLGGELRARIEELCERLFGSIGLQTSVAKYHASGAERGAVLDFVDSPLNNRWWLEDEFKKIRAMNDEPARVQALEKLARWEHPGPGSFYDDIGNFAKSPHVVRGDADFVEPEEDRRPEPMFWWWDSGKSRARLSWQTTEWPHSIVYEGLDPAATYVVRTSGYGSALLRINGERVNPSLDGREMGEFKEWAVDPRAYAERRLELRFDKVTGEEHLNWRRHSRLAEVWLIRR